eukprot:jgi/Chrzof1/14957/Cz09g22060.t1
MSAPSAPVAPSEQVPNEIVKHTDGDTEKLSDRELRQQEAAERVRKEKALHDEKLDRRAAQLLTSIRRFVTAYVEATKPAAPEPPKAAKAKVPAGQGKKRGQKQPAQTSSKDSKGTTKQTMLKKDPKVEVWSTLFFDLDEKINKSKKCLLDDFYRAVATMNPHERQVLADIVCGTSMQHLPAKQMNEPNLCIKDALFAAVAAHSYTMPRMPNAGHAAAVHYREAGISAQQALQQGYRVGQLLQAGYSPAEVVHSCQDLRWLRAGGVSVADLMQSALLDLGGVKGAVKLKAAGYTAAAIQEGASDTISPLDLRLVGFGQQNAAKVTLPPRLGKEPTYEGTAATGMLDAQHGVGPGALCAASDDVELFRHGIKPLMQMKAGQDIPLVILGTHKDKQSHSSEATDATAAGVLLSANPVKAVQMRKRVAGTPFHSHGDASTGGGIARGTSCGGFYGSSAAGAASVQPTLESIPSLAALPSLVPVVPLLPSLDPAVSTQQQQQQQQPPTLAAPGGSGSSSTTPRNILKPSRLRTRSITD